MKRTLAPAALLLCITLAPAHAYFEEIAVGARGLALGQGYVAMCGDASAHHWNPAALTRVRRAEATADYAKPYGITDLNASAVAAAAPVLGFGVALGWHHLGLADSYAEDLFTVSLARRAYQDAAHLVSAGVSWKLGRIGFQPFPDPLTGAPVDYGHLSRSSLDAGLLWQTPWHVDLGWVARDVIEPRYEFVSGTGGQKLAAGQDLAAAVRWNRESTITLGWSQRSASRSTLSVGIEVQFFDVFAIRSSMANLSRIYDSYGSPNDLEFNGGFGIFHKGYFVDATATTTHDLGASYRVSLRAPLPGGGR